ncbi:hypothetical protein V501_00503 [Pseudogymnoascus sp. VKM F-4519 (FW-2642)]|nr:hypothetical protein V501_00503 [Pseudogymnoascus sp. VKM F-4519 (FW-2642)]
MPPDGVNGSGTRSATGHCTIFDFDEDETPYEGDEFSRKRKRSLNSSELDVANHAISDVQPHVAGTSNNTRIETSGHGPSKDLASVCTNLRQNSNTPVSNEKKRFCELDKIAQRKEIKHRQPTSRWSQAEDANLTQLVQTQRPVNWVRIASLIKLRSPKQCRDRYHQNLKPTLNHEKMSPEEGLLIEHLVSKIGKRWAEIARRLHGRSDNAVKNWWKGRTRTSPRAQEDYEDAQELESYSRHSGHHHQPLTITSPYSSGRRHIDQSLSSLVASKASRAESVSNPPSLVSDSRSRNSTSPRGQPSPIISLPPLAGYSADDRRQSLPMVHFPSSYTSESDAQNHSFSSRGNAPQQQSEYRPSYFDVQPRMMQERPVASVQLPPIQSLWRLLGPSQPLLENVQSPSNMPSATQAGHPPYIQTDAMPSDVLAVSPRSGALPAPPRRSQPPLTRQTPNRSVSQHSSRAPMPNSQSLQQPTGQLHPSNRQNQVNDIVRSASRNASRNGSVPQFPGASSAGSLPVLSNPIRRSSPLYTNTAPTLASMPASQGSPLLQQQVRVPLIPLVGYTPPYQLPQPDRLLQAHLSGSILHIDAGRGLVTNQKAHRYYQAVQGFAVKPTTLLYSPRVTRLSFTVSKSTFRNVAEDKHIAKDKLSDPATPLLRELRQGSLQYRVHCGRRNKGTRMNPTGFIATDTEWPPTILIDMNDSALIIQRKGSYGHSRDQSVDITPHVFSYGPAKENTLAITVLKAPGARNGIPYSVAIEVVEVFQHQQIVDMCLKTQRITAKDVIEDIRLKLSERNDDVALVSGKLTIALRDPLTARIFTTPVRGVQCRHRECFDLETFLMSRSNRQEFTCMPDAWKCPLCGGDTRPRLLRVDEFLVSVREKLEEDGDLEVKAILVAEDGSWTAKPEALPGERSKLRGSSGSVRRSGCDYSSPAVSSRQAPGSEMMRDEPEDMTDNEDWAAIGAVALRQAS